MKDKGNYRESIVAIIINKNKKVMMCEHIWIDDAWQFPQGGIEEGETSDDTVIRELKEELSSDKMIVLGKMDYKIKYIFPHYLKEKYNSMGNEQRFFLIYYYGDDSDIRFDNHERPEFKSFQWVEYDYPPLEVIYFKKLSYLEALNYFKKTVEKFDPESKEILEKQKN